MLTTVRWNLSRCCAAAALVGSLLLPAAAGASQISFCGPTVAPPGQGFESSGEVTGLAINYYLMAVSQSGAFTIQNLQGWLNYIKAGAFQPLGGSASVIATGIVPATAAPGSQATVTYRIYNVEGQLVATATVQIVAQASTPGWTDVWQGKPGGGINSYERFYVGDFDGDGAEEILAVGGGSTNVWITLFKYAQGDWQWVWSNYGNTSADIYGYRNNLIPGDFDGSGKTQLLGISGTWMTVFTFTGSGFRWGWSNYGNTSSAIYGYRNTLIPGDYDGNGKTQLLGVSGAWMTMFTFANGDFQWGWSNYGNPAIGDGIFPYRNALEVGDFDGSGRSQLLGLSTWGTTFRFDGGDFHWGWSTDNQKSFGGWGYPLAASDVLLAGNIDNDSFDELVFLQTGANAAWATTMDFAGGHPNWHWSNYGMPPFIGDWYLGGTPAPRYMLVRAVAGQPKYLIPMRALCAGGFDMRMLRVTNPAVDY